MKHKYLSVMDQAEKTSHDAWVFSGRSHPSLAQRIASLVKFRQGQVRCQTFPNGEIGVELCQSVRKEPVFVVQSVEQNPNDALMELLFLVDALRRQGAGSITAILPWFPYSRQDRRGDRQEAIGAKVVAQMLESCGVNHLITVDLHNEQIEGFFQIPITHLKSPEVFVPHFQQMGNLSRVCVSPDLGRAKRTREFAEALDSTFVVMDKMRGIEGLSTHEVGVIHGQDFLLIDDIISTGATLENALSILHAHGARSVQALCTHALGAPENVYRLLDKGLEKMWISDTVPFHTTEDRIEVCSVASLIASAILEMI